MVRGKPDKVLPALFKEWGVTKLTFEVDTEPYAKTRDEQVERLAKEAGVEVVKCVSHTLYDTDKYVLCFFQLMLGLSKLFALIQRCYI